MDVPFNKPLVKGVIGEGYPYRRYKRVLPYIGQRGQDNTKGNVPSLARGRLKPKPIYAERRTNKKGKKDKGKRRYIL